MPILIFLVGYSIRILRILYIYIYIGTSCTQYADAWACVCVSACIYYTDPHAHTQKQYRKSAHTKVALFVLLSFLLPSGEKKKKKEEEKSINFIRFVSARIYPLCMFEFVSAYYSLTHMHTHPVRMWVFVCLRSCVCVCVCVFAISVWMSVHSMRSMRNKPASQRTHLDWNFSPLLPLNGGLCVCVCVCSIFVVVFVLVAGNVTEVVSHGHSSQCEKHKNHFTINYVYLLFCSKVLVHAWI